MNTSRGAGSSLAGNRSSLSAGSSPYARSNRHACRRRAETARAAQLAKMAGCSGTSARRLYSRSQNWRVYLMDMATAVQCIGAAGPARACAALGRRPLHPLKWFLWGRSSAGRASRSQCEGREFDPPRLHQPAMLAASVDYCLVAWYLPGYNGNLAGGMRMTGERELPDSMPAETSDE